MAQKRNREKHLYENYDLPKWSVLYSNNMDIPVACADCGKQEIYWNTYTSMAIHNPVWMWYPVCQNCYSEEIKQRNIHWKD